MAALKTKNKKISADVALGLVTDDEDFSSGEENEVLPKSSKPTQRDSENDDSDASAEEDEDDDLEADRSINKRSHFDAFQKNADEEEDEEDYDEIDLILNQKQNKNEEDNDLKSKLIGTDAYETEAFKDLTQESKSLKKLKSKKLTPEQLAKHQKKIAKTGVIYISKVPPYMKPLKMRQILSRFGEVDRLFLKPEDIKTYHKRVKYGGNKKRNYTEGWAEFVNKKDAKLCAHTLNGNILGGKKGSFYYDDVMNIKYIKGFKWTDLTEQITRENEIRQAKLQAELSQTRKLNKTFVANIEKSKMISNIEKKKKLKTSSGEDLLPLKKVEIRRNFPQRAINSKRADAPEHMKIKETNNAKLNNVLSNIF